MSNLKYIVAEEVVGGRKLTIATGAISAALEAAVYAAAGMTPAVVVPPAPPVVTPVPPAPPPPVALWPLGSTPIRNGETLPAKLAGFYALERGASFSVGPMTVVGPTKIVAYGTGMDPLLVVKAVPQTGGPNAGAAIYIDRMNLQGGVRIEGVKIIPARPDDLVRGDGIVVSGDVGGVALVDVEVTGFQQNIVFMGNAADSLILLDGVVSSGAWIKNSMALFTGQGLYFAAKGRVTPTIQNSVFYHNGLPLSGPTAQFDTMESGPYCHGIYHQRDSVRLRIVNTAFVMNQAAGLQTRSGADVIDCSFYDNGQAIIAVGGTTRTIVDNFTIVKAHRVWYGDSWDGNCAVMTYDPILLNNGNVVGGGAAMFANDPIMPGKKSASYDTCGCLNAGGKWEDGSAQTQQKGPDGKTFIGGTIEAKGVNIYAWGTNVLTGRQGGLPTSGVMNYPSALLTVGLPPIDKNFATALRTNVKLAIGNLKTPLVAGK